MPNPEGKKKKKTIKKFAILTHWVPIGGRFLFLIILIFSGCPNLAKNSPVKQTLMRLDDASSILMYDP